MQEALSEYATSDEEQFPAKDIDKLIEKIDETIADCDAFLLSFGVNLEDVIAESDTLDQIEKLRQAYMKVLENDDRKNRFTVMTNLLINLYDASKPEIFERNWYNEKFSSLSYLNGLACNLIDDEKLNKAKLKMASTLDQSVTAADANPNSGFVIHEGEIIDLSKLDFEAIKKEISCSPYKAMEIDNLREYIERVLKQMINRNTTRIRFSERYQHIIDQYNAGGTENQDYYEQLLQLMEELRAEQSRSSDMGLEEEELEIFDLLIQGRKLTKEEEQKVILASKNLYQKLKAEKDRLMVVDWYKDDQPRQNVYDFIQISLDNFLPKSYDKKTFDDKTTMLLNHFADMSMKGYGWAAA